MLAKPGPNCEGIPKAAGIPGWLCVWGCIWLFVTRTAIQTDWQCFATFKSLSMHWLHPNCTNTSVWHRTPKNGRFCHLPFIQCFTAFPSIWFQTGMMVHSHCYNHKELNPCWPGLSRQISFIYRLWPRLMASTPLSLLNSHGRLSALSSPPTSKLPTLLQHWHLQQVLSLNLWWFHYQAFGTSLMSKPLKLFVCGRSRSGASFWFHRVCTAGNWLIGPEVVGSDFHLHLLLNWS